jgi:butyryl-CoA dehydrogenase
MTLFAAGTASQKYMQALADQQEVMAAIADMVIQVYAIESCLLRVHKLHARGGERAANQAAMMTRIYAAEGFQTIEAAARKVIAAVAEGDMQRTQLSILRRLAKAEVVDTIALKRKVAARVLEVGRYTL